MWWLSKFSAILPTVIAVSFLGCGPEDQALPHLDSELFGNYGEIYFAYQQPLAERSVEGAPSFRLSARFVRVRDLGRSEVRHLWGAELPQTTASLGECEQALGAMPPQQEHVLGGSLELLDAGDLTLRVSEQDVVVSNWSFPSIYGVVAGVLYGGDELEVEFQPEREYRLLSSGSGELGAFEVALLAPSEFEALTIAGSEIGVEPVALEPGSPLEVSWEPGRGSNEVVIELSYGQFGGEQRVVCRSYDDGLEELPTPLVRRLWEPGVSDVRITIYRMTRGSFEVEGLDDAEVLFVVSASVPLSL